MDEKRLEITTAQKLYLNYLNLKYYRWQNTVCIYFKEALKLSFEIVLKSLKTLHLLCAEVVYSIMSSQHKQRSFSQSHLPRELHIFHLRQRNFLQVDQYNWWFDPLVLWEWMELTGVKCSLRYDGADQLCILKTWHIKCLKNLLCLTQVTI